MSDNSTDESVEKTPVKKEVPENALFAYEKLDRASPDMWPEKIRGMSDYMAMSKTPINTTPSPWKKGLSQEDLNSMHQLGILSTVGLIAEVRKLYDQAYQLGVMESKEMTRGRYLDVFGNNKKK